MKTRTVMYADEGMVLTDGNTYGTTVFLAEGESGEAYREITKAEYEQKIKEQEEMM